MIAYGNKGDLWFCSIEDETTPLLFLGVMLEKFGPRKIRVNEWKPIHVARMSELNLEAFEQYISELGRLSGIKGDPVKDLNLLIERWRSWEDECLADKVDPPEQSILRRSYSRDFLN